MNCPICKAPGICICAPVPRVPLHIDFETCSRVDLKKAGASRYARDTSTQVLSLAWAFGPGDIHSIKGPLTRLPLEVLDHIADGGEVHAWNTNFEMAILEHRFGVSIRPIQYRCTMQRSLFGGYPGRLEDACSAMRLLVHKDMDGYRLMLKMCKPRKDGTFWHEDPKEGPAMLQRLADYCRGDVAAERAAGLLLPNLPNAEQDVAAMDWTANRYGVRLDTSLVHEFIKLAEAETRLLDRECSAITGGAVTSPGTQTERLVRWLEANDCPLEGVDKETVLETMETAADAGLSEDVCRVLSIRQRVAKSSVKKLKSMLNCVDNDGRVRGTLQYYGAGRTGRWAGRLIQPQNFPRPSKLVPINDVVAFVKATNDFVDIYDRLDFLRTFYGEPLEVISRCLRGVIIPGRRKVLIVFDFSQIEARVLAWLAGQQDILDVFALGMDVYTYTQNRIGLPHRDAGKVVVLGLGFGTGWRKFVELAKSYGLIITAEESQKIVGDWREANPMIVGLWRELDDAAKMVIRGHHTHGMRQLKECRQGIQFAVYPARNGVPVMQIRLPSGRPLCYRNPRLIPNAETGREEIVFDGMDQTTKKWVAIRTWGAKLAENVTQATARDVMTAAAERVSTNFGPLMDLELSVHDELIWEADEGWASGEHNIAMIKTHIETQPHWAQGLPIACDGGTMQRYGKK